MFFILVIICVALIYFIVSYLFLLNLEKKIHETQNILFEYSNKRFSMFESLLNKTLIFLEYEQTFLKEIVQLRSQAKKFKQDGDLKASFFCEEKISQLAVKINVLFSEFPILNRIEDATLIQEEIIAMEKSMLEMKHYYNKIVFDYNKFRNLNLFMPTIKISDRFNDKIDRWEITT